MGFAIALLALLDEYDDAAAKVRFPSEDVQLEWSSKGETHQKLIRLITDRKGWAKAFQTIHLKLGLLPADPDVEIVIHEADDKPLATGAGTNGRGSVRFNMRRLAPYQKKLDDIDAEMKAGKLAPWIVPPTRVDVILTHELTHVVCGTREESWLTEGLATFAAGDESFLYDFNRRGARVETIDRTTGTDAYPRGLSFFRWMEKDFGSEKLKEFVARVSGGSEKVETVAAEVFGRPWDQLVRREKTWSTEYLANFKTAR